MKVDKFIAVVLTVVFFAAIGLTGCSTQEKPATAAETYPNKPITLIVPFAAGGSTDMMARALEKVATRHLGQPLIVKNVPGGAATIGWNELAGSNPDGYTLGAVANSMILQPLYAQTRYHYPTALEPLAQVMALPMIAVVRADQPWQSLQEVVEYAKQHPGEIKYGHSGLGSGNHVASEMFTLRADVAITPVPFKGEAETLAALLGGHVKLMITPPPAVKEHVKSGKLRVVGVAAEKRSTDPLLSNVPTFKEQGIDMLSGSWQGIAAPKGMAASEKKELTENLQAIINDPEFIKNMEDLGIVVNYLGAQDFAKKWETESVDLTKVVQETGIAEKIAAQKQ